MPTYYIPEATPVPDTFSWLSPQPDPSVIVGVPPPDPVLSGPIPPGTTPAPTPEEQNPGPSLPGTEPAPAGCCCTVSFVCDDCFPSSLRLFTFTATSVVIDGAAIGDYTCANNGSGSIGTGVRIGVSGNNARQLILAVSCDVARPNEVRLDIEIPGLCDWTVYTDVITCASPPFLIDFGSVSLAAGDGVGVGCVDVSFDLTVSVAGTDGTPTTPCFV